MHGPSLRGSAALMLSVAAGGACAQDCDQDGVQDSQQIYRWRANGAGFWGGSSSWQSATGGVPGSASLALFDGTDGLGQEPYAPFFDGGAGIRGLGVLSCTSSFNLGGSVLAVSGDSADCREFLLGGSLGALMTVDGGGQFRVNRAVIGDVAGTTSRLVIDGSGPSMQLRHLNPAPMIVGQFGNGKIELVDAQFVHDGPLVLGSRVGSDGAVTAFGTSELLFSAEVTSDVIVGFAGSGFIGLEQDGVFDSNGPVSLRLGDRSTGSGEIRFSGLSLPQSVQVSLLEVGGQGDGSFRVLQGSEVQTTVSVRAALGAGPGSMGTADILNFSRWTLLGSPLEVGPGGRGLVSLGEGSLLEAPADLRAFVDGVVEGSGDIFGDVRLVGGEIRPTDQFAETGGRQQITIDGDLFFGGQNAGSGLFETGRMVYTLISPNPAISMSAAVNGSVTVDGTLRVVVPGGIMPKDGEKYPIIEANAQTGVFSGVQTTVVENALIAVPLYSGDGDVYVEFFDFGVPDSVLQPDQSSFTPGDLVDAIVVDVDGDGFPDLVSLATSVAGQNGSVLVSRNLGVGTNGQWNGFSPAVVAYDTLGDLPASLAVGDMNGDLLPDLVIMNRGPLQDQVRIRLNSLTQPGDFSQVDPRAITLDGTPADITLADVSGNGLLDVVSVFQRATRGTGGGGIQVSENDGGGFDDSDGDTGDDPGSVDSMGGEYSPTGFATTSKGEASVYIFGASAASSGANTNRGSVFPLFFLQEVPAGRRPDAMFTADINGDGLDDVISSDSESGTISVMTAQDFGEIIYADAISLEAGETPFGAVPGSVVAIDVNDDGRLDLAFTARNALGSVGVRTILNIAEGDAGELIFGASEPLPGDSGATPRVLAVADLDQNGEDDLVVVREPSAGPTVSTFVAPGLGPCGGADLAIPFGVLDLADINAFVSAFVTQQPAADLAPPTGVFDLADINAFVSAFVAGCP